MENGRCKFITDILRPNSRFLARITNLGIGNFKVDFQNECGSVWFVICTICKATSNFCALKAGYRHFKCVGCGHVQISPFPSSEELLDYYSKDYIFTDCEEQPRKKVTSSSILAYIQANFQDIENASCLDIGAGNGRFLGELKALGFRQLYAVEPNESLAKMLVEKGYVVANGMMENDSFGSSLFNLINAGDVIEHLVNPVGFVQSLRSKLSDDGVLIITTPNIDSPWSRFTYFAYRHFSIPWSSLTPIAHLNNFSYSSLRFLLLSNSFQITDSYFSHPSLKYELGHTHLFRAFREHKSLRNGFYWVFGWGLYVIGFYSIKLLGKKSGHNFKMTLIAKSV